MKKNSIGLTLIETLVVIALGLSVAIGLYLFMRNLNEKLVDSETANIFIKIAGGMDNRFAVDGYAASNFNKRDWNNSSEANAFLNSFNGKSSLCSTTDGWTPNVKDTELKNKNLRVKPVPCNIFREKAPLDSKMAGKLVVNGINNQILASYVSFYYDTDKEMQTAFPRWKNMISEAYNKDTLNNSSKHIYSFMDRSKNTFIAAKECVVAKKNCALVVGVVSDEASSLIHLSTIGDNKQVGKLSFSRGLLNPQVCQKWSDASGQWLMEKTICGIENDNENVGFKLGNINSELISMDKICQLRNVSSDGYLNIRDKDGNPTPVSTSNIPCGLNTQTSGGSFVVTSIIDDSQSKDLFTEDLVAFKFNADKLTVSTITVDEKTNVYGTTDVTDTVILTNHLFSSNVNSAYTEGESLRATNFNIGSSLLTTDSIDNKLVTVLDTFFADNLKTFSIDANNITTKTFKSNGSFDIGGDIVANTFKETGVLSVDNIALTSSFFVTGSGAIGGYAEIGGVPNPEKVGITGTDATFKTNFFTKLNQNLVDTYMLQIRNSANQLTFGVNSHGGMYLKNGLVIPNQYGGSSYSIDSSGNLEAYVNYYESNGCCTEAPQQFYGPVGISGTFTINSNPRFVDVEDYDGRNSGFVVDPNFIVPNPKYSLSNYKIDSLVYNNLRLNSYVSFIGTFEASYNSFDNAIQTPGLKGPSGDVGAVGLPGDQGNKGKQGSQGSKGLTGPLYNEKTLIWLPKEVACGQQDADMSAKYGSNNKGAWTYDDVIEGLCTTGKGSVKYFKRLKPISNSCSTSQFEYDVYECKEAKYRIEPYAYNYKVQGNFCLGDSLSNTDPVDSDPSLGIVDKAANTICYTDTNKKHYSAGRSSQFFGIYYSVGGNDILGSQNQETSVKSVIGKNKWDKVSTCGTSSSRTPEDYLGLSSADLIEDSGINNRFSQLADEDVNAACKTDGAMKYRKVNYTGRLYGGPTDFDNYRKNDYNNVERYIKTNTNSCNREQVYEISKCASGVPDLTKLNYTTHPIGFIMPKAEESNDNGNGGLTGKYIWLKGDKVCLSQPVKVAYPGSTDWYPSDRIDTPCSVENAYRSEFLGVCGANSSNSSYQMYSCRDEYYKPTQPTLSYRLTDIKCLNSTGQAVDNKQKPLPVENISSYYPNAKLSNTTITAGKACYVEREQLYNQQNNSSQCGTGYTRFSVYDCR
jgi:hypothetical protein